MDHSILGDYKNRRCGCPGISHIHHSRAETIIWQDTNFCYVADILGQPPLKRVIVTNLADLLPFWKRLVGYLFDKIP